MITNRQNYAGESFRQARDEPRSSRTIIDPLENRNFYGKGNTAKCDGVISTDLQDWKEPLDQQLKTPFLTLDQRAEHARAARQARTIDSDTAADSVMGLDDDAGPPGVYAASDSPWDSTYAQFLKHGGSWQRTNRPFYASALSSSSALTASH